VGNLRALNRPGFTGGQNSRRIAHYGTDTKEKDREAVNGKAKVSQRAEQNVATFGLA
jgi:hypothetical protein